MDIEFDVSRPTLFEVIMDRERFRGHIEYLKKLGNEQKIDNFLSSLLVYCEDVLKIKDNEKSEIQEMEELLNNRYASNPKFRRVVKMIVEIMAVFGIMPGFMEDKRLPHEYRDFLLEKLRNSYEGNIPKKKKLWIEIVEFYNNFTLKDRDMDRILKDCDVIRGKLKQIEDKLGTRIVMEVVKKTSKFLFVKRLFKKCADFLSTFFKSCKKEKKSSDTFNHLSKLYDACKKAKRVEDIVMKGKNMEFDDHSGTKNPSSYEIQEVRVEDGYLSQREMESKMKDFERLDLQDQIDKADRYLLSYLKTMRERDFKLASKFYEELNKRPATDMEIDTSSNFDIKIGFILKEMLKMAKNGNQDGDIQFIDIVDLLKSLLEETQSVSTLKCQIVFYVFEYLMRTEAPEANNCELIPKIVDLIFIKYLRRREFDNPISFCRFLSRKLETGSFKGKMGKRSKKVLGDSVLESLNFFLFYFLFQAEHLKQALENHENQVRILSDDNKRRYCTSIKNFLKVIQSLGIYNEKLPESKVFFYNIRSSRLLQSLAGLLCSYAMKCKIEKVHNDTERVLRALLDTIGVQTNHHASLLNLRGVIVFNNFMIENDIKVPTPPGYDYDFSMKIVAQLFTILHNHEIRLVIQKRYQANKKGSEGYKPIQQMSSTTTLYIVKQRLVCSSAMFLFNRLKLCVDFIVSAWHLALHCKNSLLNLLPKVVQDQEYSFLLFASLFVMKGYAESLILSQFLENIPESRKLQSYIVQYINYFPKHLIEFLISPSLIEVIMSKSIKMVKNDQGDKTLKDVIISPEIYQFNSSERKKLFANYVKVQLIKYFYSIKLNR